MTTKVLIVPEDFRKDQYVLKPIIERLLDTLTPRARVRVCQDPLLGGVGEALKSERILDILDRYRGMVDLFLLIVDRDCDPNRRAKLDHLEATARQTLTGSRTRLLATEAHQEVEVWVLAGLPDWRSPDPWTAVRAHCDPKEAYYDPYARVRGLLDAPAEGRQQLADEAARNYPRIRQRCPELAEFETRIRDVLES